MRNVEYFPIIAKESTEESDIKTGFLEPQGDVWGFSVLNPVSCGH